jgi:hypothetical protein
MRTRHLVSLCIALGVLVSVLAGAGVALAALSQQVQPMVAGAAGGTYALKKDGTVLFTGLNFNGEGNVSAWTDIKQIASSGFYTKHTVGLKENGTVLAIGNNGYGACNVSGWTNVKKLGTPMLSDFTVAIKNDGSVVATGSNGEGQCGVAGWHDITDVASGFIHTVGLTTTGSVVAAGDNFYGESNVADWHEIKAVAAGGYHTVGLKSDGTVIATGKSDWGQCDVSGWHDIIAIAAGYDHTVGLKRDGTVVACGELSPYSYGQTHVSDWGDIVAIACGDGHTIGLKSNGTVVTVGLSTTNQGETQSWQLAEPDDNIPGLTPAFWQIQGWGSKVSDKYDVYRIGVTKDVPVELSCVRTSGDANYSIFLYGPDAWNVWDFSQWLPGWQWGKSGDQTETITYTPTESGTRYLLVDCNVGSGRYKIIERCSAKLNAHAPTAITYGRMLNVTGPITAAEKYAPFLGQELRLSSTNSAGTGVVATCSPTAGGAYSLALAPDRSGSWTASLIATDSLIAADVTGSYVVIPVLSTPRTTSTPRSKKYFTLTGSVAPAHAATIKLEIRKGSKLVKYKTYTVVAKSSGAWSQRLRLGKGDWRIRAGHVDAGHAQGWSAYKRIKL